MVRAVITKVPEKYKQCLRDHAIKFARWQHPAMGHGARSLCLASLVA